MWPQKLVWNSCAWNRRRLPLAGIRAAARLEIADVRDPLFLVDEQVVDDVEVFRVLLREQRLRRAAVVAAVVHVHVQVGAEELAEFRAAGRCPRGGPAARSVRPAGKLALDA